MCLFFKLLMHGNFHFEDRLSWTALPILTTLKRSRESIKESSSLLWLLRIQKALITSAVKCPSTPLGVKAGNPLSRCIVLFSSLFLGVTGKRSSSARPSLSRKFRCHIIPVTLFFSSSFVLEMSFVKNNCIEVNTFDSPKTLKVKNNYAIKWLYSALTM